MEQQKYTVSANEDQLQTKAPELLCFDWVPSKLENGEVMKNRVNVSFNTLNEAAELYYKLRDKKLVAFRNWIL